MKEYLNVLKNCPLFFNVSEENMIILLNCLGAKINCYDKKFTVFSEGDIAKYIGIILSGSVQIQQIDYYGNRTILDNITKGQIFAEEFACSGAIPLPVSAIATEHTEIMFVDCDHILHTCKNTCAFHQQLIFNLIKGLANKTVSFHQKIGITSKRSTRDKLMSYLLIESKKAKSNAFDIPFDRQELADYLEVERSGLSAEISKLRNEGIIESNKNHFKIL